MSLLQRIRKVLEPDFAVERALGEGGMGAVFEALDTRLQRKVAVKVLRPELATEVATHRFLREARLMARLKHPGVVQVHDVGEGDGLSWFVMDLVQGETLASRLARGPLDRHDTIRLARELLSALAAAHEQGIVHRDIKPANIFIEKGRALLADFGIARTTTTSDVDAALTATQQAIGTPAYMSPEQRSGENVGPASDQYSLALVLYECLTGRHWPQMQGAEAGDWSNVPSTLIPVLKRALAFNPSERFADVGAFAAAFEPSRTWTRWAVAAALVAALALGAWKLMPRGSACAGANGPHAAGVAVTVPCETYDSWLHAERIFGTGDWEAADTAYRNLLSANPGCLACEFRLHEVDRWLERRPDSVRIARLLAGAGSFTQEWRGAVGATLAPARSRIEQLEDLTTSYRAWPFAWYALGTELFNRGALFGRTRSDAIEALNQHAALDPGFAPAWTDRALAHIAAGDSAGADSSLRRLASLPPSGGLSQAQRMLAQIAYDFRFTPDGLRTWEAVRGERAVASRRELAAGPRLLPGLGVPLGGVDLGREFEKTGLKPLQRSGLIAEMLSSVALGRIDSARAAGRRLNAMFPSNEFLAFDVMLQAAAVLFDDETTASQAAEVESALGRFTRPMMPPNVRRDAAWLTALAALRRNEPSAARAMLPLLAEESGRPMRRQLIEAALLGSSGQPDSALAVTDALATDLEAWDRGDRGPFLRAAVRLLRAQWFAATGIPENARSEYRWHEHFHLSDYPVDNPLPADGDWAFSTLAYWRQARLLDRDRGLGGSDLEVCASYRHVVDRWSLGDARFRARADTARARLADLQCVGPA